MIHEGIAAELNAWEAPVRRTLADLQAQDIPSRIRGKDHTVWKPDPAEISDRLGWLDAPEAMEERLGEIQTVVDAVRAEGLDRAVLLGMGGSSLAPEVFRQVFGVRNGSLDLTVLDSTDPEAVLSLVAGLVPEKTLFVVSTKSGGTVETISLLKFFFRWVVAARGRKAAGRHFLAITDPGSALAEAAARHGFRHTFLNDPEIGGRYSALSCFGLVPALLLGMDGERLLAGARAAAEREWRRAAQKETGAGAFLGGALGCLARAGRDKLTLVFSPRIAPFGAWIEQLLAESTGKEGKGILPVVDEPLGPPAVYGADRVFLEAALRSDPLPEEDRAALEALRKAGHPTLRLVLETPYDLGPQCYVWEVATAVAGHVLGVHPFDQPDVESAKTETRRLLSLFREQRGLPAETPTAVSDGLAVYGFGEGGDPAAVAAAFLAQARSGDYVALQAYVRQTPALDEALRRLRLAIRDRWRVPVTVGYGPRFLHSTGQLHKGDAGRGLFLQLTGDHGRDAPVPDAMEDAAGSMTFGNLIDAQARGDEAALRKAGRRVMRCHLAGDPVPQVLVLATGLA